jgi:integrase
VISLGQVIDEWLKAAEHESSTRETYLGYIERTIKPALGSMPIAKLAVRHPELCMRNCGAVGPGVTASPSSSTGSKDSMTAQRGSGSCQPE